MLQGGIDFSGKSEGKAFKDFTIERTEAKKSHRRLLKKKLMQTKILRASF